MYIHIDGFGGPGQSATDVINPGNEVSVETDICGITTLLCWENDCHESNSLCKAEYKVSSITTVTSVGTDNNSIRIMIYIVSLLIIRLL